MLVVKPKEHCPYCNSKPIEIRDHESYIVWDFCYKCRRYLDAKIISEKQRKLKDTFNRKYGEVYLSETRNVKLYDIAIA